jgi:iron complex outermembrane recepter protein
MMSWMGMLRTGTAAATAAMCVVPASAQGQASYRLDIPAQAMDSALTRLAAATHTQIVFRGDTVRGKHSNAVSGSYTADAAIAILLRGSGLTVARSARGVFVVTAAAVASQNEAGAAAVQTEPEIVVTGSHIAGAPIASPVVRITQQRMREAGQRDLGEVIRSIPSNYGGGQNPGARFQTGDNSNTNVSGSSALNLRGLGPDATLTLLNGRRLAYDANSQAVDISVIPLDAVSSIEVVADGASAIYGSDAVGGVANVILRPDYDGLSTAVTLGGATRGGGFQQAYEAVGGGRWRSGGVLVAVQYEQQDAVRSSQRDYTRYVIEPNTLLDAERHYSGLVTAHQDLGPALSFSIDALYSHRYSNGAEFSDPDYAATTRFTTESYAISPNLTWQLGGDWRATLSAFTGADDTHRFDDFIDKVSGDNLGGESFFRNRAWGGELDVQGRLVEIPGGAVRVAMGAGYRHNGFETVVVGSPGSTYSCGRGDYYGFGELSVPLVSAANGMPLLRELAVSAAVRHEEYDRFGGVTTPKLGLVYAPLPGARFLLSWGRSFKAPTLAQQYGPFSVSLARASQRGAVGYPANATVLISSGGNPDLGPERARTVSATLELEPALVAGLRLSATWYDIDYRDRVVQPLLPPFAALSSPALAEFIQYNPTPAEQAALIARDLNGLFSSAGPYIPGNVVAIANGALINAARQRLQGVDLVGSYVLPVGADDIMFAGFASWLTSSQQNSAGAPALQRAGTNFSPPRFRARGSVTGHFGAVTVAGFANYVGHLLDTTATPATRGDDMTTFDLNLIWQVPVARGPLGGVSVSLSAQNITDARPPYLAPLDDSVVNYDSTNYSPLGRFIRLSLRKTW